MVRVLAHFARTMARAAAGKKITVVAFEASASPAAKPRQRVERFVGVSSQVTNAKSIATWVEPATISVYATLENARTLGRVVNSTADMTPAKSPYSRRAHRNTIAVPSRKNGSTPK